MAMPFGSALRFVSLAVALAGCAVPVAGGADAERTHPQAPLTVTRWKLVQLGSDIVSVPENPREPHIVLQDGRAAGSGGCNRMSGGYTLAGKALRFTPMIATKMFCEGGMRHERPFFEALERTSAWRIDGTRLELLNDGGSVLAGFEARPPL